MTLKRFFERTNRSKNKSAKMLKLPGIASEGAFLDVQNGRPLASFKISFWHRVHLFIDKCSFANIPVF